MRPTGKRLPLIVLISAVLLIPALLLFWAILTLTSIDTVLVKPFIAGIITDSSGKAIPGATILVPQLNITTTANEAGAYTIDNLPIGSVLMVVSAEGFEDLVRTVEVSRSFLNYLNAYDFTLLPAGFGSVSGRLIGQRLDHDYSKDKLSIDDQVIRANPDGSFAADGISTGQKTLKYESDYFVDVVRQFRLEAGSSTRLENIELLPAADLVASLESHLRKQTVLNAEIIVEGVSPQNVSIDASGTLRVRDLEVGREYKMLVTAPGYVRREYVVTVVQGPNQIPGFKMVESGLVAFLARVDNEVQVFTSNLDGSDRNQLTFGKSLEPAGLHLNGDIIYFLSARDRIRSTVGGNALVAYALSTQGANAQRITTNTVDLGRIIPAFPARKLANVSLGNSRDHRKLEVMDITGNNRVSIDYIESGSFTDIKLSINGAYIYYYKQNTPQNTQGLYRANARTGESQLLTNKAGVRIMDVSEDGDRAIYSAPSGDTGLTELYSFTASTGQDVRLLQNVAGRSRIQFLEGSKNLLLFQSFREGATNMYSLDLDTGTESRLTNFSGVESLEVIYQQSGYIMYQTNVALYVMDPQLKIAGVSVTTNAVRYNGYDF